MVNFNANEHQHSQLQQQSTLMRFSKIQLVDQALECQGEWRGKELLSEQTMYNVGLLQQNKLLRTTQLYPSLHLFAQCVSELNDIIGGKHGNFLHQPQSTLKPLIHNNRCQADLASLVRQLIVYIV